MTIPVCGKQYIYLGEIVTVREVQIDLEPQHTKVYVNELPNPIPAYPELIPYTP